MSAPRAATPQREAELRRARQFRRIAEAFLADDPDSWIGKMFVEDAEDLERGHADPPP